MGIDLVHGDLNLDRRIDLDGSDALDDLNRAIDEQTQTHSLRDKINHTLVDSHLEVFPGVGTLSARGLTGGDTQDLGGHADGTRNLHLLAEGNALDLRAH